MASLRLQRGSRRGQLTLGIAGFEKISAVEGIRLSPESRRMFDEFERRGLSAEERRKAIAAKHARKA